MLVSLCMCCVFSLLNVKEVVFVWTRASRFAYLSNFLEAKSLLIEWKKQVVCWWLFYVPLLPFVLCEPDNDPFQVSEHALQGSRPLLIIIGLYFNTHVSNLILIHPTHNQWKPKKKRKKKKKKGEKENKKEKHEVGLRVRQSEWGFKLADLMAELLQAPQISKHRRIKPPVPKQATKTDVIGTKSKPKRKVS